MDSSRLENIKNVFQQYVAEGKAVGASVAVFKDNQEQFYFETGFADREAGKKMSRDTIFRCFSMTKPVTAVAAMILLERGIIELTDPVSKYIPEFDVENMKVESEQGLVTSKVVMEIHHLLNMTAGTAYPDENHLAGSKMAQLYENLKLLQEQGEGPSTVEWCRQIAKQPLHFEPGEKWMYGTEADILAGVIEVASGMKYSDFLKKEIFEPLGMKDTDFYVPEEKWGRFARLYEYKQDTDSMEICTWNHLGLENYKKSPHFESGGAGLVSTIEDYSRFAGMLANGGTYEGKKLLSSYTVEYMSDNMLNAEQRKGLNWDTLMGYGYGNLCRVLINPAEAHTTANIGSYGWDGWTGNYFQIDPVENLVVMYVIQKCGGTDGSLVRKLLNMVYAAL